MANALYDSGREGFGDGSFDWLSATVKALFVGPGYTPNLATDKFVSIIPSGQIIARSPALTGKVIPAGVADADNLMFVAVPSGIDATYLALYAEIGADATSRLIALDDTATGLPFTPAGGAVAVVWDSGAFKIFKL